MATQSEPVSISALQETAEEVRSLNFDDLDVHQLEERLSAMKAMRVVGDVENPDVEDICDNFHCGYFRERPR